jgi:hypothetical protein
MSTDLDWRERGKCWNLPRAHAAMFPDDRPKGVGKSQAYFYDHLGGARICEGCEVLAECYEYAQEIKPSHGIWAGMTPNQLKARRRKDAA